MLGFPVPPSTSETLECQVPTDRGESRPDRYGCGCSGRARCGFVAEMAGDPRGCRAMVSDVRIGEGEVPFIVTSSVIWI